MLFRSQGSSSQRRRHVVLDIEVSLITANGTAVFSWPKVCLTERVADLVTYTARELRSSARRRAGHRPGAAATCAARSIAASRPTAVCRPLAVSRSPVASRSTAAYRPIAVCRRIAASLSTACSPIAASRPMADADHPCAFLPRAASHIGIARLGKVFFARRPFARGRWLGCRSGLRRGRRCGLR